MTIFHHPFCKLIWFAKLFGNLIGLVPKVPKNCLSFDTVCRGWTFRPALLEQRAKGPLGHSNQNLEARRAIKSGWISRESDRHLKSIDIFCYCLLGVHFSPLTGSLLHFFSFCAAAPTQHSQTKVKMGMSLTSTEALVYQHHLLQQKGG